MLICLCCKSQDMRAQEMPNAALTADSLATGNYKDVLASFFQIAFDRFTGPDKELRFTSNPFAVIARLDTSLLLDYNYYRYRKLRDFNFAFAGKLDDSYKFNGFSSGIKYAIINQRDETVSRAFLVSVSENARRSELRALNRKIDAYISRFTSQPDLQTNLRNSATAFTSGEIPFSKLHPDLKKEIKAWIDTEHWTYLPALIEEDFNFVETNTATYDSLKALFNKRWLWTVAIADTTYSDQFMFSNIVLSTEVLKGVSNPNNRVAFELTLKSSVQFIDDTLRSGRDLKRSLFNIEPAVNIVLTTKRTKRSFLEFKFSGGYYHTLSALYPGEEKNQLFMNATMRLRVFKDIWIPLDIKYDPLNGNVFGFLNVRANFTTLGQMAKNLGRTNN